MYFAWLILVLLFRHAFGRRGDTPAFLIPDKKDCGKRCRFKLCDFKQTILLGAPKIVDKEYICKLGTDLTDIVEVGEASISKAGSKPVPISRWRPRGLETPFIRKFFGAGEIPGDDNPGIFTGKTRGKQYHVINGTCVVLPIKKYKIARLDGSERTIRSRGMFDCLSFNVRTTQIMIELEWFSGDDLDLSVREPDGTIINFRKDESRCGRLLSDNCVDCCDLVGSSRERVVYKASCRNLQRGEYRAIIRHATNCGMGATRWITRLIVNGVVTKSRRGESNKDAGRFAGRMKFRL